MVALTRRQIGPRVHATSKTVYGHGGVCSRRTLAPSSHIKHCTWLSSENNASRFILYYDFFKVFSFIISRNGSVAVVLRSVVGIDLLQVFKKKLRMKSTRYDIVLYYIGSRTGRERGVLKLITFRFWQKYFLPFSKQSRLWKSFENNKFCRQYSNHIVIIISIDISLYNYNPRMIALVF